MFYEAPEMEVVGTASELIQNHFGGHQDGGPTGFNALPVLVNLETE